MILAGVALNPLNAHFQFDSFAVPILVAYLTALAVLSIYGIHRCWLVYTYVRWRHNAPTTPAVPAKWPSVTIQLPTYNERYVIARLVDAVAKFDYPSELLDIQVLDDSTDETREVARACVEQWQRRGLPIRYMHRSDRSGFKAGALEEGLKTATGELVAMFDADFIPGPDFLRRTVPYFVDSKLAVVQTRWTYLNRSYSLLTEIESLMLDGHFVVEQGSRSRSGAFFNFNGTAGLWRRVAIEDAGGWQHDTLTEDTDLSYRAQLRGWRFLYLQDVECPSELPVEMNAFKVQQARWSKGLIQTAKKLLPRILQSDASVRVKAEAFFHLTAGITSPIMVVFSLLLLPASFVPLDRHPLLSLWINLCGLSSTAAVVAFYLVSQRSLYPRSWKKSILYLPLLFSLGIDLALSNTKAVMEALLGHSSDFVRTPKYNIDGDDGAWHKKQYWSPAGWVPYLEIAFGIFYIFVLVSMWQRRNYLILPFVVTFILGFLGIGFMSLVQRGWKQLREGVRPDSSSRVQPVVSAVAFPSPRKESDRLPFLESAPAVKASGESTGD